MPQPPCPSIGPQSSTVLQRPSYLWSSTIIEQSLLLLRLTSAAMLAVLPLTLKVLSIPPISIQRADPETARNRTTMQTRSRKTVFFHVQHSFIISFT
ncbi:hypothetical protein D4A47_12640 [Anaerotruncus massiliensis (ex Liu et al. 2021)]|uniref:Uncharacterized protein n=1 Tax=Anaerotruncus massiliensis (ex Liu et al. 2021) TaxID=2321404 RepID=A0A498CJZ5_9FIRM|nr:hypothetical protein D4A47_12640 [Anaerotruncus massiliensis (ex Liu et al. 2021)]